MHFLIIMKHLTNEEKITALTGITKTVKPEQFTDPLVKDTLQTVSAIKEIQLFNGEQGSGRYIISQCNSALNAIEVFALFLLNGWKPEEIKVDIVPLFETVDDLLEAEKSMRDLYTNPVYAAHLKRRKSRQTIMLGFSDGTKDGGYLMANFSIYKAKEDLTRISREYGIDVVFFDGRGGPPARGGGKTHKFYSSLGRNIENKEIQLTIQGQTVSSNFGIIDAAQFNMEQLIHAGISNDLFSDLSITMDLKEASSVTGTRTDKLFGLYRSPGPSLFPGISWPCQSAEILCRNKYRQPTGKARSLGTFVFKGSAGHSFCRRMEPAETKCYRLLWCGYGHEKNG